MKKAIFQQIVYKHTSQRKTINTTTHHICYMGYNPIGYDNMKATFEIDTNKGERNARFSRISKIGQISGLKDYAGREAIVLILEEKTREEK